MENAGSFFSYLQSEGKWIMLILLVGVFSFGICIERLYSILLKFNINGKDLMTKVKKSVMGNKISAAISLCDRKPTASLARIFKSALISLEKPSANLQKAVDDSAMEEIQLIMKRTSYLPGLANVATLLGLLGTINGLINSFSSIGAASPEDKQNLLALGISEAMHATLYGLIVAIPTLLFYSILQNKTTNLIDDIDKYSARLVDLLLQQRSSSEILTTNDKTRAVVKESGKKKAKEDNEESVIELLEDDSE